MNVNVTFQVISALALVVLAVLLVNPFAIWMPTMMHMLVLGIAVVVFGIFCVFALAERTEDERGETHKARAGRAAFLAGGSVLIVGIILQTFAHALDPWLVGALVGMVVAKVFSRLYDHWYC